MQMQLDDFLKQYGVESGQIVPDDAQWTEEAAQAAAEGDLDELIIAKADEIDRSVNLVEALEVMAERAENEEVTEAAMESYRFNLACLFKASGIDVPVSLVAPSFEAADGDKKSFKEKASGAIQAVIKWIREKVKALFSLFTRSGEKTKAAKAKAEADTAKAQAAAKAYADDGIKKLASNGLTAKYTPQKGDGVKVMSMKSLPAWMVSGDQIAWAQLDKFLAACNSKEVNDLMQGDIPNSKPGAETRATYKNLLHGLRSKFPGGTADSGGGSNGYEVDIPKLATYIKKFADAISSISGKAEELRGTIAGLEKRISRFEARGKVMDPAEKESMINDIAVFNLAIRASESIIKRPVAVHQVLTSILA